MDELSFYVPFTLLAFKKFCVCMCVFFLFLSSQILSTVIFRYIVMEISVIFSQITFIYVYFRIICFLDDIHFLNICSYMTEKFNERYFGTIYVQRV